MIVFPLVEIVGDASLGDCPLQKRFSEMKPEPKQSRWASPIYCLAARRGILGSSGPVQFESENSDWSEAPCFHDSPNEQHTNKSVIELFTHLSNDPKSGVSEAANITAILNRQ